MDQGGARSGETSPDEVSALRRRVHELEQMVEHLADANIRAAELVGELEEARAVEDALRRHAEEVALLQAIDHAVASSRYLGELAVCATQALLSSNALECEMAAFFVLDDDTLMLVGGSGVGSDTESACRRALGLDLRTWWSGDGDLVLCLRAQERPLAVVYLRIPARLEWRDRWLPGLRSMSEHLSNAVDRLQVEARERALIGELADARDRALAATQAKDHFLSTMSHELRTPLNVIIGYSEMLVEDAATLGDEPMHRDLRRISSSGKHLLALINDMLDLSKIEAGKITLLRERFSVADALRELGEILVPLVERNRNAFTLQLAGELGEMVGDPGKLRQVLLNLLSNACKFTDDGQITLTASTAERDLLVFEIADTGIGMSEEQLARVFEPFVQARSSTSQRFGGTGLGLTISANYAALMGGSIQAISAPGQGARFTLTLPRAPA